jgi:hypothetical protein
MSVSIQSLVNYTSATLKPNEIRIIFLKRLTLHIKEQKQQLMKSNLTKGKDLRSNSTLLKHFIKNILTLDILTIH